MVEVAIHIGENETRSKKRLFLRTLLHTFYAGTNYSVMLYGCYMILTISEEYLENPMIYDAHRLAALFLTNWNYMFQTVFLSLALLYDVLEWLDKHRSELGKKLMYYRDVIFCGLVVPFTLFISCMFWTVYFIDRELVFPKIYDQVVPWWFNHCVHTNITVMVLVETLLQERRKPANQRFELSLVGGTGVLYAIVYYGIFFITGRWLYAVFGVMTWWQVCLYQLLIWGSTFVFYYMQFPINRIFHREPSSEQKAQNGVPEGNKDWGVNYQIKHEKSHL